MDPHLEKCVFYCVSYNSPERTATMKARFANMDISLNVHTGVQMDDPRLAFAGEDMSAKRLASVFYGHLDNIADFWASGKEYGFFCEDDVHIHKRLKDELPTVIRDFNNMDLDILLLGYMTHSPIEWWMANYPLVYDPGANSGVPYRYHRYHREHWGIHLFMISRKYAGELLATYDGEYAARQYKNPSKHTVFNPDWILSKHAAHNKRALRWPGLAVEDGKGKYEHFGQGEFHRLSHNIQYVEGEYY